MSQPSAHQFTPEQRARYAEISARPGLSRPEAVAFAATPQYLKGIARIQEQLGWSQQLQQQQAGDKLAATR